MKNTCYGFVLAAVLALCSAAAYGEAPRWETSPESGKPEPPGSFRKRGTTLPAGRPQRPLGLRMV
ncbi:MAG: hypothetical protein ACLUEV_06680 [Alistipes sp.]